MSEPPGSWMHDVKNPDGTHTVTITGVVFQDQTVFHAYHVSEPNRYAEMTFAEALRDKGVSAQADLIANPDFMTLAVSYTPENQIAEHVSPPLIEEAKVTLKVSQNVHANMMPYILGSTLGMQPGPHSDRVGFQIMHKWLQDAGLDVASVMQNDGAGAQAMFTPDFVLKFLVQMSRQPFFPAYIRAMPIMGKDGTQSMVETTSDAAGHVFAKTGTRASSDALNQRGVITANGLVGYIVLPDGRRVLFAAYVNFIPNMGERVLSEIASAIYDVLTQE